MVEAWHLPNREALEPRGIFRLFLGFLAELVAHLLSQLLRTRPRARCSIDCDAYRGHGTTWTESLKVRKRKNHT